MREAYAKVLGPADPGLDSNFFDLGGDSLLAAQIVLELDRNRRRGALRITDVFDHPTIRSLAARLELSSQSGEPDGPHFDTFDARAQRDIRA